MHLRGKKFLNKLIAKRRWKFSIKCFSLPSIIFLKINLKTKLFIQNNRNQEVRIETGKKRLLPAESVNVKFKMCSSEPICVPVFNVLALFWVVCCIVSVTDELG